MLVILQKLSNMVSQPLEKLGHTFSENHNQALCDSLVVSKMANKLETCKVQGKTAKYR